MPVTFQLDGGGEDPVAPRAGQLTTERGKVPTPAFMPVGTLASVKALTPEEVTATGARMLLVNAYHLYLRPGHQLIESLGGVHRFMAWDGPILSDSGGYQVFSLARLMRVNDEGVRFRSHIDGTEHHYTPEIAMQVQRDLGVDIAMPLDHVLPWDASSLDQREAAERTLRWFDRCRAFESAPPPFAIVQGGVDEELRRWHARELAARQAHGYAIGGLSVGETKADQYSITEIVCAELPTDRPRYLMGVGSPEDLVHAIARGIDMFDCVLPTRLGRTGSLFTDDGRINIRGARFRNQPNAVDPSCDCVTCTNYSLAYLHHLFRNEELLGYRLASIHNLRYLQRLCKHMREAILQGVFGTVSDEFLARYKPSDQTVRTEQRVRWGSRSKS